MTQEQEAASTGHSSAEKQAASAGKETRHGAGRMLLNSEERYRLLVDSAQDYAMFFLDTDNRILDWNIGAERITGYTESEIIGEFGSIIFTPEDIAAGAHEQELHKARTEGRAENERWHVRKDGSLFWGSGIVMSLCDDADNLIGYAKVMRDFTDRRCAQQERDELLEREQKARAEAEAANRARDKFIGVISHELRSPLQTILGWVDLLCRGHLDREMEIRAIETIQRNAALQNRLINDLLDITRIEAGTLLLNIAPVDLKSVVEAVIDNVRPMADAKGVRLQTVVAPDMEPVPGDAERLQQVVTNLVNNAVKFTPEGGQVEVRVARPCAQAMAEATLQEATLQVADNGIGISPDFLPHVFEAYTQAGTRSHNEQVGLGLGLSIVHELVRLHGGSIDVESKGVGQGSTFTVHLPLTEQNSAGA
jgi:PAS domain S-box-containing protein